MAPFLMTPVKWLHSEGGKETVKAKCEEAETETEELIKLIHLVGSEGQRTPSGGNFTLAHLSQHAQ